MHTDVAVVGAGLSGLALARDLERAGIDYRLFEARDRVGGRIKSIAGTVGPTAPWRYDLGPAWFWPGQARIASLIQRLGLAVFEQYSAGNLVFEDAAGLIRRDLTFATMAGSLRLANGMASLTDALVAQMERDRLHLDSPVYRVERRDRHVGISILGRADGPIRARRVVLALPPRLAIATIAFDPELSAAQSAAMASIPTWMAGHAKVVAVYDRPFWRDAGLSGDAISHRGPLAEIHDASPSGGGRGALFGFVSVPVVDRIDPAFGLDVRAVAQLTLLFGESAANPLDVIVEDWANDPFTATATDRTIDNHHPSYGLPAALRGLWEGDLILASTETGTRFGGYLEGALESAEAALRLLTSSIPNYSAVSNIGNTWMPEK